jgi:hypothetical protein
MINPFKRKAKKTDAVMEEGGPADELVGRPPRSTKQA